MRRRDMLVWLGASPLLRSSVVCAQQPGRIYRLGILGPGPEDTPLQVALRDELRRSGFVEGQNLRIERHSSVAPNQVARLMTAMAASKLDAIFTAGAPQIRAVQQATQTIPIVTVADDLQGSGLVRSLAHPSGNMTGISILATELDGKRQELLTELVSGVRHIAALADPGVVAPGHLQALEAAARRASIELSVYRVAKPAQIAPAIDAAHAAGAQALNVLASPLLDANEQLIRDRAAALGLPAIYQWPENAEAGGLAAYGPRFAAIGRQSARQLVKIFRGAKPSDLPVEQPDKFELVVNLNTAKALGLTVPQSILARADEVIE